MKFSTLILALGATQAAELPETAPPARRQLSHAYGYGAMPMVVGGYGGYGGYGYSGYGYSAPAYGYGGYGGYGAYGSMYGSRYPSMGYGAAGVSGSTFNA